MIISSLALLINTHLHNSTAAAETISFRDPGIRRAIIIFIGALVYAFAMTYLGFIPSTIIFMMFMMYKLQLKSYGRMFIVSLLTALAVVGAFQGFLDIQLPMGFLENFF